MYPRRLLLTAALSLLTACGGGGGGGTDDPSNPGSPDTGGGSSGSDSGIDLIVTDISAPPSANADSSIDVSVSVKNQGGSLAPSFGIQLSLNYYDSAGDDSMTGLGVDYMLDAGDSASQSINMNIPRDTATGRYYLVAEILADSSEYAANNRATTQIDISGTTCTPDDAEQDNGTTLAKILQLGAPLARNHCEGSADWFRFDAAAGDQFGVRVDESSDASVSLAVYDTDGATLLPSSGTITDTSASSGTRPVWTAPASGVYYARVAPLGGLMSAGANTDYMVTRGDLRPDLVETQNATLSGADNVPGGIIYVADTVVNKGFADAGAVNVGVYVSDDAMVTTADRLIGSRQVPALPLGTSSYQVTAYSIPTDLAPGTYYVAAIANPVNELNTANNTTNALALNIGEASCAADAFEEDDNSDNAKTIVVNDPAQTHNHCEDTIDWLSFDATTGASYAIRTGGAEVTVDLYSDPFGSAETPSGLWTAPSTGTYYLRVSSASVGSGDYTIKVDPALPDLTAAINAYYSTTTVPGGLIRISDRADNIGHVASGPFKLGIYRGSTSTVTSGDSLVSTQEIPNLESGYFNTTYYGDTWVQFPKELAPGTYYLGTIADYDGAVAELDDSNNASPTTVAVTVTAPGNCTLDSFEDDDFVSQAQPINAGTTQARNFCDDDRDWVAFTPDVDGTYVAKIEGMYADNLGLYDADGVTELAPHDAGSPMIGIYYLSLHGTAGQTYYLKAGGSMSEFNATDYSFSVAQCTPDPYEEDDTRQQTATEIAVTETQTHNLCDDGHDWISFSAVQGTTYTFTAANVGADADVEIRLYPSDNDYDYTWSGTAKGKETLTWTATGTGTYYVQIVPKLTAVWGLSTDYTITLN